MIKLFEQFNNEQEIREICKKYKIENYTINPDGSIDVDGDVDLRYKLLYKLPLKFNRVNGSFFCYGNSLSNLDNSPVEVNGDFDCYDCSITSLIGSPIIVGKDLMLTDNPISIIDSSIEVRGDIHIDDTNFDDKIKEISQDKLRILFEHGLDYDIFRKDGSINDSRLKRMFSDFNI